MIKSVRLFVVVLVAAILIGCAALGTPAPATFNQKLAVTVATVTEVRNTAATLVAAKKISAVDAQNVQAAADVAREGVSVARGMSGTNLTEATTRLELAQSSLKALQAYLLTKQGGKP